MDELFIGTPRGVAPKVEFKDGVYDIPQYMLEMIIGANIDPLSVTHDEAVQLASNAGLRSYLNGQVNDMIREHRKTYG